MMDSGTPVGIAITIGMILITLIRSLAQSKSREQAREIVRGTYDSQSPAQKALRLVPALVLLASSVVFFNLAVSASALLIDISDNSYYPEWLAKWFVPDVFYFNPGPEWRIAAYAIYALAIVGFFTIVTLAVAVIPKGLTQKLSISTSFSRLQTRVLTIVCGVSIVALVGVIAWGAHSYVAFTDRGMLVNRPFDTSSRVVAYEDIAQVDVECIPYVFKQTTVNGFGLLMTMKLKNGEKIEAIPMAFLRRILREDPGAPNVMPGYAQMLAHLSNARVIKHPCYANKMAQLDDFKNKQHDSYFGEPYPN